MSNSLTLTLDNINPSIANAIRRTIISDLPTLAIENVRIIENTSSLYDEIIAHRLGQIPIKTDLGLFNFTESCRCKGEGCPSCTLELSLKAKGKNEFQSIYSNSLKSKDSKIKPIEDILILRLGKGQEVSIEAEAILGTGKDHAKWQPAVVGYKYYPSIKIDKSCNKCEECIDACPMNILKLSNGKAAVTDPKLCTLCNSCAEACDIDAITVSGDDSKFIFKIESSGALPPKEILQRACGILEEKAHELSKIL